MTSAFKIAAIGLRETTRIYRLLGAECFAVADAKEAEAQLIELTKMTQDDGITPVYAIVFVEETFHKALSPETIERLLKRPLPSVIPLPTPASDKGDKSYGVSRLSTIVERAIGSDLLS